MNHSKKVWDVLNQTNSEEIVAVETYSEYAVLSTWDSRTYLKFDNCTPETSMAIHYAVVK